LGWIDQVKGCATVFSSLIARVLIY